MQLNKEHKKDKWLMGDQNVGHLTDILNWDVGYTNLTEVIDKTNVNNTDTTDIKIECNVWFDNI